MLFGLATVYKMAAAARTAGLRLLAFNNSAKRTPMAVFQLRCSSNGGVTRAKNEMEHRDPLYSAGGWRFCTPTS